jgi:lactobin A/cerein 7B family class IIb bacteriocin
MTTSFETLSVAGTELTNEQLTAVDGGLLPIIFALAVADGILWGYIASH